jgi:two-component system phosphate regulon sensor histidine kinase PhoR
MISNNLFLSLIIYFLMTCLSVMLVAVSGIVYLTMIPIVLAFVFTLLIYTRIDKSVNELTDIVLKASRGDFSGRYKHRHDWEIEPLGLAVNDLLENVAILIRLQQADREDLKLLLGNISEAIWIQDRDGILVWTSYGFEKLFPNYKTGYSRHFWEVVTEPSLLDYVKADFTENRKTDREILLNNAHFLVRGIFNPKTDTQVYVLQSIEQLRQTEQMKKDFITNLAHELRTPLTAVKGFTEALSEAGDKNRQRYLNIIRNHTDRLISLVSDLQILAGLERLPELNLQPVNLVTFLQNVKALYHKTLEERGLSFEIIVRDELPHLRVDTFKFEQIFINLIDNALRYTSQGGIRIELQHFPERLQIRFADTGSGIEANHLPRIFERFYVADPSRNRASSGTGLGLAIVKHCVQLHHGLIEVESSPGAGTAFIMTFPLTPDS